jgi:uncharacterized glyoxalase superfamily protein PhnB
MKITANLFVEAIEPSLAFWVDRMGFQKTVELPETEGASKLGFAILVKGGVELMLQTLASVAKDESKFLPGPGERAQAALFIEVDDFEDTLKRLAGYLITMPERTTFYGMREIGIHEPGGHIVLFAKPAAA